MYLSIILSLFKSRYSLPILAVLAFIAFFCFIRVSAFNDGYKSAEVAQQQKTAEVNKQIRQLEIETLPKAGDAGLDSALNNGMFFGSLGESSGDTGEDPHRNREAERNGGTSEAIEGESREALNWAAKGNSFGFSSDLQSGPRLLRWFAAIIAVAFVIYLYFCYGGKSNDRSVHREDRRYRRPPEATARADESHRAEDTQHRNEAHQVWGQPVNQQAYGNGNLGFHDDIAIRARAGQGSTKSSSEINVDIAFKFFRYGGAIVLAGALIAILISLMYPVNTERFSAQTFGHFIRVTATLNKSKLCHFRRSLYRSGQDAKQVYFILKNKQGVFPVKHDSLTQDYRQGYWMLKINNLPNPRIDSSLYVMLSCFGKEFTAKIGEIRP